MGSDRNEGSPELLALSYTYRYRVVGTPRLWKLIEHKRSMHDREQNVMADLA